MLDKLALQPNDPLLDLIGLFNRDSRTGKIDLGVGVYRDEDGHTPVMRAVKSAERHLLETQDSKSYVAPEGDPLFLELLWRLAFPAGCGDHAAGVQTPGGTAALRLASDVLARAGAVRIWLGLPSWPNHAGIFSAAGLAVETYPYFDTATQSVLFDRMIETLKGAAAGDAVLLHASCHNPTGAGLDAEQWKALAELLSSRGLVPLIDSAYQGFGSGIAEDMAGAATVLSAVPEGLIAISCSKNFGLYRERTGAIFAVCGDRAAADAVRSNLALVARTSYSMPPDHGAAVVRTVLGTPALREQWEAELTEMRDRLNGLRTGLSKALAGRWQLAPAIASQQGMFSLLPIDPADVLALRKSHGLYMASSGRINIAGLGSRDVERVGSLFAPVLAGP